jgi:hypothetical protein
VIDSDARAQCDDEWDSAPSDIEAVTSHNAYVAACITIASRIGRQSRDTAREGQTALFDSVTGNVFGQIFGSSEDADAYLEWVEETYGDYATDVRVLASSVGTTLRQQWENHRQALEVLE